MKFINLLLFTLLSSPVLATMTPPAPQNVPVTDGWGLLAISLGVAIVGLIAKKRLDK